MSYLVVAERRLPRSPIPSAVRLLLVPLLLLVSLVLLFYPSAPPATLGKANMVNIRWATPSDVDAVVDVVIQAMPYDPQWDYRFPYRKDFPDDHRKYTRMLYEQFADPSNDDWRILVIEVQQGDEEPSIGRRIAELVRNGYDGVAAAPESGSSGEIVAFSVWDVSYLNKRKYGPSYKPQNRKIF
jgi:hypothetical protein